MHDAHEVGGSTPSTPTTKAQARAGVWVCTWVQPGAWWCYGVQPGRLVVQEAGRCVNSPGRGQHLVGGTDNGQGYDQPTEAH